MVSIGCPAYLEHRVNTRVEFLMIIVESLDENGTRGAVKDALLR
jgi:hypothetical protein